MTVPVNFSSPTVKFTVLPFTCTGTHSLRLWIFCATLGNLHDRIMAITGSHQDYAHAFQVPRPFTHGEILIDPGHTGGFFWPGFFASAAGMTIKQIKQVKNARTVNFIEILPFSVCQRIVP